MRTRKHAVVALTALALVGPAVGEQIYECQVGGRLLYQDYPCGQSGGTEVGRTEYEVRNTGVGGQKVSQQILQRVEHEENADQESSPRRTLGYEDRTRIRELEMERGQLQDQLKLVGNQGLGNHGKALAISNQIRSVNDQIAEIWRKQHGGGGEGNAKGNRILGYGDKTRIRELEMERGQLQDQLKRVGSHGLGNHGKTLAISEQIRSLDQQIAEIRRSPTGH